MTKQSPTIYKYLLDLIPKDFRRELEPMRRICVALGNPQLQVPTIHVAGTNGKGSTCAFLESILRAQGLRVGLMTSPDLIDLRERIQINRQMISAKNLETVVETICGVLPEEKFLSFFEMMVLAGFQYFKEQKVDVAVVEVGLGGRLDATNVVQPAIGVLTPISLEHQEYLGNTLAKIAGEKCGILKRGMQVVTGEQPPEVMSVIEDVCGKLGLQLYVVSKLSSDVPLGLAGDHQRLNAALALKTAELWLSLRGAPPQGGATWQSRDCFPSHGVPDPARCLTGAFARNDIEDALSFTHWPGRLQYLSHNPLVLLDGAHNPAGAKVLVEYLTEHHSDQEIILLFGCMRDKDVAAMAKRLGPWVKRTYCVVPRQERALDAPSLTTIWNSSGFLAEAGGGVVDTYRMLLDRLQPGQMLVGTGSLFLIAELLAVDKKSKQLLL